ncbi:hypothetical protein CAPTEDRAFT_227229 [Capitella teleta]|uniref:PDZ domain-containing protein n=1 Tax=Capitella teleta TaxID=283909 RepID=R7U5J7_CAPTE|nr:hypothetical protein CAPTEDRAFT_227229 [Capitella teleta]|eukprot:ELU01376.1 hypothetical protein CAPTEDRAFT_227229 [Capitella teleta]
MSEEPVLVSESDQSLAGEFRQQETRTATQRQRSAHNITFANCDGGLGIKIIGGIFEPEEDENEDDDRDFGIFIRKILPEGVAASDRRLKEGDQILSVNGHSLEAVTNADAVNLLRQASTDNYVSLTVTRDQIAQEDFDELTHAYTYSTATSVNGSSYTSCASSPGFSGATLTPQPPDQLPPVSMNTHPNSYAHQGSHLDTTFESHPTSTSLKHSGLYSQHSPNDPDSSTPVLTPSGLLMFNHSPNSRVHHSPQSLPDGASSLFSYVPQGGAPSQSNQQKSPRTHKKPKAPTLDPQALQYLGIQPSVEQQKELRKRLQTDNDGTVLYGDFVHIAREMFQKQLDAQRFCSTAKLSAKNYSTLQPNALFMPSPVNPVSPNYNNNDISNTEAFVLKREKDLLRAEIARLKGTLRDKELKCIAVEGDFYKLQKEVEHLSEDNRSLRSKVHIAEQAQKAARTTEHDYEQVVRLLEDELAELRSQQQTAAPSAGIPDIQRRLAVLGCQLRKAEVSKKTYEVATDKLLKFAEHVQDIFATSKSSSAQSVAKEGRDVSCAVKALIEVDTLPFGWDEAYTENGIKHYINHVTQQTSWQHPVTKVQHSNAMATKPPPPMSSHRPIGPLPKAGR